MPAATRDEISAWFDQGVEAGHAFMVTWVDRFDNDDYPVYYASTGEVEKDLRLKDNTNLQNAVECYDLHQDKEPQLTMRRCWMLRAY